MLLGHVKTWEELLKSSLLYLPLKHKRKKQKLGNLKSVFFSRVFIV